MSKKNINLIAKFTDNGKVLPMTILWDNGQRFDIDRIIDIKKRASQKAGGIGIRYTCMIKGQQRYLYNDENYWYIETDVY